MSTLTDLFNAIPGQWEKVIATVALIAIGMLFSHLWARSSRPPPRKTSISAIPAASTGRCSPA